MRLALCVGASACSLATSAFAQSDVAAPHTDIRITATDSYEDNVLRTNDSVAPPPGYSRSDFRFTPAVVVDIVRPFGRQSLFLTGSGGYDFYKRNKRLERERISLNGGADLRLGGDCSQHLELGYGRQQSDLRDFFSTARLRNAETRKTFEFAANCAGIIGFKPGITYDYTTVSNSEPRRKISDFRSHTLGGSLGYVSPALGEVSLYASFRMGTYPDRSRIPGIRLKEDIDVYSGGLRYSRSLGTRFRGSASAGYTRVKPKLPGSQPFRGISYSADLNWVATTQLKMFIAADRAVNQSNLLDDSYSVDDSFSGGATYALTPAIQANIGASFAKRNFKESALIGPSPFGRRDKTRVFSGGLNYSPRGRIGMGVDLAANKRSSPLPLLNYKYFVARFTVRFGL